MGDKTRTAEEQAAYNEGRADERRDVASQSAKSSKEKADAEKPKHLEPDYTGPLTGDQAAEINARRAAAEAKKAAAAVVTKPASTQATK